METGILKRWKTMRQQGIDVTWLQHAAIERMIPQGWKDMVREKVQNKGIVQLEELPLAKHC